MTGETLSHYRVLERIGEGATSVVYKAEDLALGRPVALKVLPPAFSAHYVMLVRVQHEARTLSSLNHPNICTIYEIGEHGGHHFMSMEFLDGQCLSGLVCGRPVETVRLLHIAIQIAEALEAAHAEGIIHRDLKPANVFLRPRDHVKVIDFGLAVLMPPGSRRKSRSSAPWLASPGGTVPYMSPEQTLGEEIDTRTDLFSMGVVLYEMATARMPFDGATNDAIIEAIQQGQPVPARDLNPSIPAELDRIISKSLEKSRELRYQTASDLSADLRRLKRDLDSQDPSLVSPQAARARVATRSFGSTATATHLRRIVGGAGIFAAAVVAVALVMDAFRGEPTAPAVTAAAAMPPDAAATALPVPDTAAAKPAREIAAPASPTRSRGVAAAPEPISATAAATATPARPPEPVELIAPKQKERDPLWAQQQMAIAKSKADLKLYDQAITTLRDLIAADSTNPSAPAAYLMMGAIHEARGSKEDALATYLDVAARYPSDSRAAEAMFKMAQLMMRSGRPQKEVESRKIYTDLVEKYPSSTWAPQALMARAEIEERLKLQRYDAPLGTTVPLALDAYQQVAATYATSSLREDALWKTAQIYVRLKKYDLAVDTLTTLGRAYPASAFDPWFVAAEIIDKRLKDDERAKTAYARVPVTSAKYQVAQKRLAEQ